VHAVVDGLYQLMTRPETPEEARRVAPARPSLPPLPHARVGALAGFLELLAERGGRDDLHRLAGDLQLEVDDLLPLVDAAALLGFARVEEGDAVLTADGALFVEAPIQARKDLFRRHLLSRLTLVSRIHAALQAKHDRRLPEAFFLDVLEKHFSAEEARRQLATAIDWGRYAELFGFEDDTDELFLEPESGAAPAVTPQEGER